jgi:uncharacterized protein
MEHVRVEITSLSVVPSGGGTCAILLREADGERILPVVIGLLEAQAIAVKLQGVPTPRPLTHDLMNAIMTQLHGKLVRVTIDNVREGTFFATMEIDNSGTVFKIDSRPSDAIALALRFNAPIFVSEEVMDAASSIPENLGSVPMSAAQETDAPVSEPEVNIQTPAHPASPVEELEAEMKSAIKAENYERAAQLRDEIQRLRSAKSE